MQAIYPRQVCQPLKLRTPMSQHSPRGDETLQSMSHRSSAQKPILDTFAVKRIDYGTTHNLQLDNKIQGVLLRSKEVLGMLGFQDVQNVKDAVKHTEQVKAAY